MTPERDGAGSCSAVATVVGEAIVDVIRAGGETARRPGGSPLNIAVGLSRLGIPTHLVARIGDDSDGELLRDHLRASSVHLDGVLPAPRTSTAAAMIRVDGSAEYEFDIDWDLPDGLGAAGRLVHFGSISATLDPGAGRVEELVRGRGAEVLASYDPNIRVRLIEDAEATRSRIVRLMALSDVVKLSDEDAEWIFPGSSTEDTLQRILDGGTRFAAITRGAAGAILRTAHARVEIPTLAGEVVDTVGAGDSFMAGLLFVALRSGLPGAADEEALRAMGEFASRCSAVTVSRSGADLPWIADLL